MNELGAQGWLFPRSLCGHPPSPPALTATSSPSALPVLWRREKKGIDKARNHPPSPLTFLCLPPRRLFKRWMNKAVTGPTPPTPPPATPTLSSPCIPGSQPTGLHLPPSLLPTGISLVAFRERVGADIHKEESNTRNLKRIPSQREGSPFT
ncbi:unnamed protein product [Gadus morhua 'NCC']